MSEGALRVTLKAYDDLADRYSKAWVANGASDFYSSPAWIAVLQRTFSHIELQAFEITAGSDVAGWLAVARTRGRRCVSLPLSPAVDFVPADPTVPADSLLAAVQAYAVGESIALEYRSRVSTADAPQDAEYFTSVYAGLQSSAGRLQFATNAKRNVKKAKAAGVHSADSDDFDLMWEFLQRTRRRQGTPMYPRSLLAALKALHAEGGPVTLRFARTSDGQPISGVILLEDRQRTTYAFGASCEDKALLATGGNALLFSDSIMRSYEAGKDIFDFGITPRINEGLVRFKEQFGARNTPAAIFRTNPSTRSLSRSGTAVKIASRVLQSMPDPLYRAFSPLLFNRLV